MNHKETDSMIAHVLEDAEARLANARQEKMPQDDINDIVKSTSCMIHTMIKYVDAEDV